ncbi:hypothetical protein Q5424_07220 [Conexibacter sp. JD483]|uniref:hypothetical protein n=1 Tax=unclassified Conexibacter TaxID=2627773 RepID=UPI002726AEDE|nr:MULTISPECIES: hypothetical protein [unclassified Conexibacter]MDO8187165.1 hypothetical protein [Conexibacter sp. CPCC 205706]MDO8200341.1 hypothetical protein [Conexibacter sp. CPCC 205762]MDR9368863.1 hypothetical protein [Conexibacter sp. JD483]
MTTFAADHDTDRQLRELDDRMRTAWDDYRNSTTELAGVEYEDAELISWERLQQALDDVASERQRLSGAVREDDSDH